MFQIYNVDTDVIMNVVPYYFSLGKQAVGFLRFEQRQHPLAVSMLTIFH